MTTEPPHHIPDTDPALCAHCGAEVPVMDALVYHGVVYHPACVFPRGIGASSLSSPKTPGSDPTPNPSPS